MKSLLVIAIIAFPFLLVSCGSTTAPTTFTIGGTVSGLVGTGLVLQDNGGDNLPISQDGSLRMSTSEGASLRAVEHASAAGPGQKYDYHQREDAQADQGQEECRCESERQPVSAVGRRRPLGVP